MKTRKSRWAERSGGRPAASSAERMRQGYLIQAPANQGKTGEHAGDAVVSLDRKTVYLIGADGSRLKVVVPGLRDAFLARLEREIR